MISKGRSGSSDSLWIQWLCCDREKAAFHQNWKADGRESPSHAGHVRLWAAPLRACREGGQGGSLGQSSNDEAVGRRPPGRTRRWKSDAWWGVSPTMELHDPC